MEAPKLAPPARSSRMEAVVIGASAGAVEALSVLLPRLPAAYSLPILIVVHLPPDKKSAIAELFQAKCQVQVKEAEDKEPIRSGTVYFAPPNYHLLVEPELKLSLSNEDPVIYSRPSIDVLFESAADAYGAGLVAVILTGANNDGAQGVRAVCEKGGLALVQDPKEAHISAMPLAALAACPGAKTMNLDKILAFLQRLHAAPDSKC